MKRLLFQTLPLALVASLAFTASCSAQREMLESTAPDEFKPVITHTAMVKTTAGDFVLELYGDDAPKTVANFVGLAKKDAYDSLLFHRVVPGFVIQGGDPKSKDPAMKAQWGQGGTSIYDGAEFEDELDAEAPSSKRGYIHGALAMANRGPNTNTSQFFVVTANPKAGLPHAYTIFGYVRSGMEVVDAIGKQATPNDNMVRILDIIIDEYKEIKLDQ